MFRFLGTTLAVSALVLGVAYLARPRFPETASNHGLKTIVWAYMRIIDCMTTTGGMFGFSQVNIVRSMFDLQLLMDKKLESVEEYSTVMDGVEVTVFKPAGKADGLMPGIVHYHGGGWVLLSPAHYAPVCRALVEHTQSIIVSVNYRKAPEHLFPVPIEDCLKATRFLLKNAEKYGIDPNKIGVKGDSAGGNLAMAAALRLSQEADPDLPSFKFMSLDYPALQAFDFDLPCYRKYTRGPGFLNKKMMIDYWLAYAFGHQDYFADFYVNNHTTKELKEKYADNLSWELLPDVFTKGLVASKGQESVGNKELSNNVKDIILDPLFAPLMATDEELSKLPQTYVMNAEFDVLRDDGFLAVERLKGVGIEVEHSYLPAEEHGFLNLVLIDKHAEDEIINFSKWFRSIME